MTATPKPDPLRELAAVAAGIVASGHDASELRDLADRIATDERSAIRAGRLLGVALAEWAGKQR